MNIGIYNPYLDTLGGGERYCLDIASCLAVKHDVHIFWDDPEILTRARRRFHTDTTGITLVPNIWKSGNIFTRAQQTRRYDVIFFVSDGSIPFVFSKKAFLIFQFPVPWVQGKNFLTRLKVRRVTGILCYSDFVKTHLDRTFGEQATILAPAIDVQSFMPRRKERLILSVGRFTTGMNAKKQAVLIDTFKRMYDERLKDWRLILAGGLLKADIPFVEELRKKAKGYPIELLTNVSIEALRSLYGRARIYWHAAGVAENLERNPGRAEPFGITTLEAMSPGAVPIVFAGGGQKDIVGNWFDGFLGQTTDELREKTLTLINDTKIWSRFSKAARARAKDFSKVRFCREIQSLW